MSDKPKQLPSHTRVGIFNIAPSVIYNQTTINEEVETHENDSVKDSKLELKTKHRTTVEKLAH